MNTNYLLFLPIRIPYCSLNCWDLIVLKSFAVSSVIRDEKSSTPSIFGWGTMVGRSRGRSGGNQPQQVEFGWDAENDQHQEPAGAQMENPKGDSRRSSGWGWSWGCESFHEVGPANRAERGILEVGLPQALDLNGVIVEVADFHGKLHEDYLDWKNSLLELFQMEDDGRCWDIWRCCK